MRMSAPKNRFCAIACVMLILITMLSLCGCAENGEQIKDISDLNGKTIVSVSGTVNAAFIKQRSELKDAEIVYALNNPLGLSMLFGGKADAMVIDNVFALSIIRKYDSIMILDEMLEDAGYGIAFADGSPLADQFSGVIREMKSDGSLSAMTDKWLSEDAAELSVPEQTGDAVNATLHCSVAPDNEPICYKDGEGNYLGLDIDLVITAAQRLGYRVEFSETAFEDLLPSVAAGQTDMAVSGITVTDERDAAVDFSETYLDTGTVLIVRKAGESTAKDGLFISIANSFNRVFAENDRWRTMLKGLGITLLLCTITIVTGLIFGSSAFMWDYSGSKAAKKILGAIGRVLFLLPISTYLLMVYYLFFAGKSGNGFWAAVAAFTVSFGFAVYSDLKKAVGTVSNGQVEATRAMGYNRYQALMKLFLPQVMPDFLTSMQGDVVGHIRATALVEFIAVQDFQAVADMIHAETNEPILPILLPALVYIVLALAASYLIKRIRIKVDTTSKTPEEIRARALKGRL